MSVLLIALLILMLFAVIVSVTIVAALMLDFYGVATTGVPFVPVPRHIVDTVKELMPLKVGDTFYDLGSGDGRVVCAMAAAFPQARIIGIEKAPFPYLISRFKLWGKSADNAKLLYGDFSRVLLSDATHVYLYLFPEVVDVLLRKLERELKPGTRVVSCDFPFTGRTAQKIVPVARNGRTYTLYLYEF